MCRVTCLTAWHGVVQAEDASHAGKVRDRQQALEEAASTSARATQVGVLLVHLTFLQASRNISITGIADPVFAGLIVLRLLTS